MPAAITRHFAAIADGRWGARQVHDRRGATGPLLVLLHQSPRSSLDLVPTAAAIPGCDFEILDEDASGRGPALARQPCDGERST